jgi:hypothetical protein
MCILIFQQSTFAWRHWGLHVLFRSQPLNARGHLLQQWLQEWPHRVIFFYSTGHSRWEEVSSTKLQFKDRENPTWLWILDAVGCSFVLLRRVCWPTLEECYVWPWNQPSHWNPILQPYILIKIQIYIFVDEEMYLLQVIKFSCIAQFFLKLLWILKMIIKKIHINYILPLSQITWVFWLEHKY